MNRISLLILAGAATLVSASAASAADLLINQLEGHLYSLWLTSAVRSIKVPVLALIVSGGHTELVLATGHQIGRASCRERV